MKVGMKHQGLEVAVIFTLTNMTLTKSHLSKTKAQVSILGPLVLYYNAIQINIIDFVLNAFGA